ncbi:MFS transporter [Asaia bogorensis]|uniref:MFS transporter n=1 Tax=Asaia bogorensis TaxID=91915 RepID=UPI000EFAC9A7|nr:MFS transporter [Asaia bogorensis]
MMNRPELKRLQNSTRTVFFLTGAIFALWSCLVPVVKQHAGLNDGSLGLLLLCLGCGSVLGMPLAGLWVGRWGCRPVALGGLGLAGAVLLPLSWLSFLPGLALGIFLLGVGLGAVETAINIQAVEVEQRSDTPLLSGFHAWFSIGGAVGAAVSPVLTLTGMPLWSIILSGQILVFVLALRVWPGLLHQPEPGGGEGFALPRGLVWVLGLLTGIAFLAEGAVLDWGAVFLQGRPSFGIQPGWGYAVFATAMTLGRLSGDRVIALCGRPLIMGLGGLCAGGGFALVVMAPVAPLSLAGFFLIGLGCANIVPVLYNCAGRQRVMKASTAVAAITTLGYAGILAGPALVGAVAHATSLSSAFLMLAALMIVVAGFCRLARQS